MSELTYDIKKDIKEWESKNGKVVYKKDHIVEMPNWLLYKQK